MRANHGGSPVVLRIKTGSRHPVVASCTGSQAREAVVERDVGKEEGAEAAARCGVSEGTSGGYK
jgi:hypothetical protein